MKQVLLMLAGLLAISGVFSQDLPDELIRRDEISFSFTVNDPAELESLKKIISIDRVDGLVVKAYANTRQYLSFMKLGYAITIHSLPTDLPDVRMEDHTILGPLTTWNFYPTYSNYESIMLQFATNYPSLCSLDTIATLASGRRLLVVKISDNVASDEPEPEFLYSSTIHGNETTGYVLMLHLIDYLLTNYGTNPEATDLVNNMEIWICPNANPDGTYYGGNSTVSSARRYNINGVDLNRNYPDPQDGPHPDGNAWQPETVAFMDFAAQHHFVAGANFHGGVEVVNYPWDTWPTLHADDDWYEFISREYADTVHVHAVAGYMTYLDNGVTNGYAWYEVDGGRQDYMNYYHHCRELTIEISDVMLLPAGELLAHWDYNWRSFILMLKQARYGIHGTITDAVTGQPVSAEVFIQGHDNNESEVNSVAETGEYHRPVKGGTYTLVISAPCYQTQTISGVSVADYTSLTLNIQMTPATAAGVTTAAVTAISSSGATAGGEVACSGSSAVIERGVCWSTSINPVVTGNHTVNGTGTGSFISTLTGLLPSTLYHVRAYATNASGTSYGNDVQFTTGCGSVSVFPYNEGFEHAGTIPSCWTQEQVNNSGVNWTFITGSGNGHPTSAHGGTYNACLKDNTSASNLTRLITPPLDLSQLPSPQLKFWHTQALWSTDQDQLSVYYRTSASGGWTLLFSYTSNITVWTQRTLTLPNPSATYYIAFEGNAKYGYGVCVDDVSVSSACAVLYTAGVTVTASANPVNAGESVTFTATPVNGGASPVYQWRVNGVVAGSGLATYTYVPANHDTVTCLMTSNLACVTGNPALSNAVVMEVISVPATLSVGNLTLASGSDSCFGATQTITVAGDGLLFIVENGGMVEFVAGSNILFLPGAQALEGSYLHGTITETGVYCGLPAPIPAVAVAMDKPVPGGSSSSRLMIFPNPTRGIVNIKGVSMTGDHAVIELYAGSGQLLLRHTVITGEEHPLDLSGFPPGIYLVRLISNEKQLTGRIIRE